jgi:hypothetical protein
VNCRSSAIFLQVRIYFTVTFVLWQRKLLDSFGLIEVLSLAFNLRNQMFVGDQ